MKSTSRRMVAGLLTPSFVTAVAILAAAAVLAGPIAKWMRFKQNKEALPLKNPLAVLDADSIAPYRVVERVVLKPAIVDALGTTHYLNWALEDTSVPPGDPLRRVHLFVTYYSGGNNLVPHTPDVCFVGSGYQPAQPHDNMVLEAPGADWNSPAIPVRVCTFVKSAVFKHERISVVYTFHCNGRFVATRTGVRLLVNTLSNTYAYFSKIEVSFPKATRTQTVEGARRIFNRVLPVLLRDHWPDFQAAERQARQRTTAGEETSYGIIAAFHQFYEYCPGATGRLPARARWQTSRQWHPLYPVQNTRHSCIICEARC